MNYTKLSNKLKGKNDSIETAGKCQSEKKKTVKHHDFKNLGDTIDYVITA